MVNQDIIQIFHEMAIYFLMKDAAFKPQAYERAVLTLEALDRDLEDIYKEGGEKELEKLPGIGKNMANKIVEYIKKGKVSEYQALKKEIPVKLGELTSVEGVGPKKIKALYEELGIKNLRDLERVAKAGKINVLPGFGAKSEKNILESIEFLKSGTGRFLLGNIWNKVEKIKEKLGALKEVKKIGVAGSIRRGRETVGDVDILVTAKNPDKVVEYFIAMPGIVKVWGQGRTKVSVRMKEGFDMDLRIVPEESYGSAMQYFTGSKEHNITTRKIAIGKGMKLNEYGLFEKARNPNPTVGGENRNKLKIQNSKEGKRQNDGWIKIAGETEDGIYEKIGMQWVPPEMRENKGEVELAQEGRLPKLVDLKDIKGELHCHSHWNLKKGRLLKELVERAIEIGYEYIGISDHTKFLAIEHGLDEKELMVQNKFIKKLNSSLLNSGSSFRVLHGCEANVLADGSIDIRDSVLAKLDYVIAGVHSQLKMSKEKMTERIITAMKNPHVDIISHPTSRIIQQRDESAMDFDKILKFARETKTVLEINASPSRLDLKDVNIRKAKEAGVKMIINSDAHKTEQLLYLKYGVTQARRGWAEKKDIINTLSADKLLKALK